MRYKIHTAARLAVTMMLLIHFTSLSASDLKKEKRWVEQIEESLMDGEVVYLKPSGKSHRDKAEFFTIYTKISDASSTSTSAILLLHGSGVHPDWPQVIHPLRTRLPESGWTVLSIQLPILANDSHDSYQPLIKEATPRIHAAIAYLKTEGFKKVVIVAHSMGTVMASHYLAENSDNISGYIAIGMPESNVQYLAKIKLPLLDLYGSDDLPNVLSASQSRKKASATNTAYQQKKVKDADHFFEGQDDALIQTVLAWLQSFNL